MADSTVIPFSGKSKTNAFDHGAAVAAIVAAIRSGEFPDWSPPTKDEWAEMADPYLISLRAAAIMARRPDAENVKAMAEMDREARKDFLTELQESAVLFGVWARLLEEASQCVSEASKNCRKKR